MNQSSSHPNDKNCKNTNENHKEPAHPLRGSLGRLVGASLGRLVKCGNRLLIRRGGAPSGAAAYILTKYP
jgi:hypothetical protein